MQSWTASEEAVIQQVVAPGLEDLGYNVSVGSVLAAGHVADVIAVKDGETLIFEIKAGRYLPSHALYQARLLKAISRGRFPNAVVIVGTTAALPDSEKERFRRNDVFAMRIGESQEEFERNLTAAF